MQLFSFEPSLYFNSTFSDKSWELFFHYPLMSGCSLRSIMFVIWAWLSPYPPSSLLLSVPATVPSACLLTSPGPRPSRPLPSWPPPATHSRTIVIISSPWVSYLHHHKMPGLDVNILKDCAPYWYYIQSHYSGLLSITRWETGWNMESDIQDHNSGDVVIIPDELSSCDRSLSDNSLQISLHYVWPASRRLWGTIAHLPRWSRSLLNKTFHKIVLVRFYDA